MCAADFGLSVTWVTKMLLTTPYLRQTLGSGPVTAHVIWSLGPLSGLLVAPLIGVLSDRCASPHGRRRPYIAGGLAATLLGMNLFAAARNIPTRALAIPVAVGSFGLLDVGTNAMMFPARAMMGDLVAADQQHDVQSAAAVIACVAEIVAGSFIFSLDEPVAHIGLLMAIASVILFVTAGISLYVCHEQPLGASHADSDLEMHSLANRRGGKDDAEDNVSDDGDRTRDLTVDAHDNNINECMLADDVVLKGQDLFDSAIVEAWRELKAAFHNFPRPLAKIGIVYSLSWACWFACLPVYSAWIGESVLGGDPEAKPGSRQALLYQRGVTIYAIANVAKAVLAIVFSAFYPRVLRVVGKVGERTVFGAPFIAFAAAIWFLANTKSEIIAGFVIAVGAIPFICTQAIPTAMAVKRYPQTISSNLGILNLFCVGAQLLDTLYTGSLAKHFGESFVMKVAGIFAMGAGVAAFVLF
jgi:Major Facilitator Superfamily